ncbi:MAG: phage tail protein [Vallitalea sp.]|jgi:hypothetical protein|nr:phage tail protein [Vallitalea sp.]
MQYIPFDLIKSYKKNEPIQLNITVCKPDYNRTPIQGITGAYNKEITKRFSSVDEIRFQIDKSNDEYDLIKGDFVLLVEFNGNKQYFIIKECEETIRKKTAIKNVVAYSYEYIFSNKLVRSWKEGQQPLSYMMSYVISQFPSWKLGITEPELMLIERTMEVSEQTILEFLIDIQKKYLCIFEFDTVNRTINIRNLENIGKNKGFVLSERNYANSIDIKPNFQEVVTRLKCYGKDNMTINGLNPTGQSYIETYAYYMAGFSRKKNLDDTYTITGHSDYMSDGLCNALTDYKELIKSKEDMLKIKYKELSNLQDEMNKLLYCPEDDNKGLNVLKEQLKGIQLQIDALIRQGENDLSVLKSQETSIKNKITSKQKQVNTKQSSIDAKKKEVSDLKKLMKIENNLTEEQIKELDMFTREKTWADSSYFNEKDLYEEGQNILLRLAQPSIKFSVDVVNYLRCIDSSEDWEYVTTGLGDIVKIEADTLNLTFDARLVEYTYSETDNEIDMNFSNKSSLDDPSIYLKDLLKESISTSTTINMEKTKYGLYDKERSKFSDYLDGLLDLSKKRAFAGINQEVVIDERGILLTDTKDIDRQVKLIGDLIAFTNDGWNTSGTAISSEGVIGEAIYGKVIAGSNLSIENTSGSFKVNADGVTIRGASLNIIDGLPTDKLSGENLLMDNKSYNGVKINSQNGVVVRTNDDDISKTIKTTLNASEGIKIEYYDGSRWIDKFKVDSASGNIMAQNLQLMGGEIRNSKGTRVFDLESGTLYWNNININGNISFNELTDKPSIPTIPSYIRSTSINSVSIMSPQIIGGSIKTIKDGNRIEIDHKGIISYESNTIKHGFSLSNDGNLQLWVKGNQVGEFTYDDDGAGSSNESKERIYIKSLNRHPIKIKSADGISLEVAQDKMIHFQGDSRFYGDVEFRGKITGTNINAVAVFG